MAAQSTSAVASLSTSLFLPTMQSHTAVLSRASPQLPPVDAMGTVQAELKVAKEGCCRVRKN